MLIALFILLSQDKFSLFPHLSSRYLATVEHMDKIVSNMHGVVVLKVGGKTMGTAFFVDQQHLLTNYHVVQGGGTISALSNKGNVYNNIQIVKVDPPKDVAFLKIDGVMRDIPLPISTQSFGVGDAVYIIGHPLGLAFTLTDGIISRIYRDKNKVEIIQTSAPVAPGSSGSPLLNSQGEVIGIVHSGYMQYAGLNFATSINSIFNLPSSNLAYGHLVRKRLMQNSDQFLACRKRYARDIDLLSMQLTIKGNGQVKFLRVEKSYPPAFKRCLTLLLKKIEMPKHGGAIPLAIEQSFLF